MRRFLIITIYISTFPYSSGFDEIENEIVKATIRQRVKEDRKVYSLTTINDVFLFKKEPESVDKIPLQNGYKEIYMNFNDSSVVKQVEYQNQFYILTDKMKECQWDISEKQDIIQGKPYYKAVLRQNPSIIAWFNIDIPITCAPFGYHGLPGLVVRMELPFAKLELQNIKEVEESNIIPPTKGSIMSVEEYEVY